MSHSSLPPVPATSLQAAAAASAKTGSTANPEALEEAILATLEHYVSYLENAARIDEKGREDILELIRHLQEKHTLKKAMDSSPQTPTTRDEQLSSIRDKPEIIIHSTGGTMELLNRIPSYIRELIEGFLHNDPEKIASAVAELYKLFEIIFFITTSFL